MRIRLLAFAFVVCLAPLAAPAQEKTENPYKKAKVGDFVAYRMTTSVMGKDIALDMKQTLSAKDDFEATLKTSITLMGNELKSETSKVDLTKPFDPVAAVTQGNKKGKFEKTGEGKEKIKVGGKEYDCTWVGGKVVADVMGKKLESDVKIWIAKTVPLSGMVKMEIKSNLADVKMELSDSGSAK
jgi:hypothetical protein